MIFEDTRCCPALVETGYHRTMQVGTCQGKVYGEYEAGHAKGVLRVYRWTTVLLVALALASAWPASAAPYRQTQGPASDQLRQFLETVIARIDIELPDAHGICTGWVGWTEAWRSAVYTAAHCYAPHGKYRTTTGGRDAVYADGFAKWDKPDLMALWIPQGRLPVLRAWKPLPTESFRAMYMLYERNAGMHLVEVDVPRVYSEIRFENHPTAVAVPLHSYPGTSGAPIIDLADGLLVGMVVGYLDNRPDIAAVVPAQTIYQTLLAPSP